MFFRKQEVNPEVRVAFADKVMETPEAISVRPATFHPFPGCISAIIPTIFVGGIIALVDMIFNHKSLAPLYGAGCVFILFYVNYHIWNFRRKRGDHNLIIDKVSRRIHLRDVKSHRRVSFPFEHVESITDRHDHFGDNLIEYIQFSLNGECSVDDNPPIKHFKRVDAHSISLWRDDRIESGKFGDLLAEIIRCPITHTK